MSDDSAPEMSPFETRGPETDDGEQQFRQIVENLDEVVWLTDPEKDGQIYINPAYEEVWGHSRERLYEDPLAFLDAVHPDDRERVREALEKQPDDEYDEVYRIQRPDGSIRWIRDRSVQVRNEKGEVYRIAGIAKDVTEQKNREHCLTGLAEVTRDLFEAESRREIADIVVRAADERLQLPLVSIYFFEEETDTLRPVAQTPDVERVFGDVPPLRSGESLAGEAFADGTTRCYDDVRKQEGRANPDTPVRSELIVPVGEFGVFLVGSTSTAAFGETDVEYVELLAANTEAALEQVGYKQRLERQNERLRELARLNGTIRSINQSVLEASTKEEIATEVCETIVENDPYFATWIGEFRADQELCIYASKRRSWFLRGIDEQLLSSAREAIRTDRTRVTEVPTAGDADESDWLRVATVPLTAGETTHGVLALYTVQPDLFDDEEVEILRELGQTVGRAMRAAETRKTLTSETATQLEFGVTRDGSVLVALSEMLGCRLELEGVVPVEDDRLLYYVTVEDVPADEIVTAAEATDIVETARTISAMDDGGLVELTVAGEILIAGLTSRGASVQNAVADRGEGHIVAEIASETDVRTLVRALEDIAPGLELRSRQELDRPVTSDQQFQKSLGDRLTDRQLEVLRAAFRAGYFEWPRDSTAEDIAASFDVASSTVHFHLRNALQSMLATFLEENDVSVN